MSKNFCAEFDGPNRSRLPSGASPIFSSILPNTRPTARYWNPYAEHWPALRGICRKSFIVGIPCTPMRDSKGSKACSRQLWPEPGDTGTWIISSPWSTWLRPRFRSWWLHEFRSKRRRPKFLIFGSKQARLNRSGRLKNLPCS